MKKLILLLLVVNWTFAQDYKKTIDKDLEYNGQPIVLDVSFAHEIEIKTWDKNEVSVKAEIAMEKETHLNLYELSLQNDRNAIFIKENTKNFFEALKKERRTKPGKNYYCCNSEYEFNYTLFVPKNSELKVKSINGSLKSDEIVGEFTTDLINGDIDIKKYKGNLVLSTINGSIDLFVAQNQFEAKTINGNIYADENLKFKAYDRHVGQHIESTIKNSSTVLKLNTINGNMYLR